MKKFPNRPMRIEFRNGNKKVQFNPETVTERDIIDALANNNINVDPELKKLNDEFKAQKKIVMDEFDKAHGIRSIAIQNLKDNGVEEPFSTVDLESEKNAVRAVVLGEVIRASKQAGKIKDEL